MGQASKKITPWYAGEHKEAIIYVLTAIFFVELIVGGVAFFYGIIHARPEAAGGPPLARFPWLVWAIASILAPAGLLLIVHLAGTWVSRAMTREEETQPGSEPDADLPPAMRRFYTMVRHAPTVVILLGILLLGAALFFIDGALEHAARLGAALIPYIPWITGSLACLLALCFLIHALMVFRQRKMENEYAWRREVLAKTGLVLVDKNSVALPQDSSQQALIAPAQNGRRVLPAAEVLEITAASASDNAEKNA